MAPVKLWSMYRAASVTADCARPYRIETPLLSIRTVSPAIGTAPPDQLFASDQKFGPVATVGLVRVAVPEPDESVRLMTMGRPAVFIVNRTVEVVEPMEAAASAIWGTLAPVCDTLPSPLWAVPFHISVIAVAIDGVVTVTPSV